jgi:predicted small lipoprotein YifL
VRPSLRGRPILLLLVVCAGAFAACGKKGPPLPPLARVPTPPANPQALRVGDDVYVSFGVPSANVSGQTPADVSAIELYAFTGAALPAGLDPVTGGVRVGEYPVFPPQPTPPPPPEGAPAPPALPRPPGFEQGATAVVREVLTPEALVPTPFAGGDGPRSAGESVPAAGAGIEQASATLSGPLVPPSDATGLKRFYFLVAQGSRGRASTPTTPVAVPLQAASAPPTDVGVEYTATALTLRWTPPPDARAAPAEAAEPGLLPSKPLTPPPPATTYLVFEAPADQAPAADAYQVSLPTPLIQQPIAGTEAIIPGGVAFGVERCFVVRAVDTVAGAVTLGRASEPGCITPVDTFPPAPPQRLAAIAGVGAINLIWEANTDADLAGYIVLRGTAPGDTLQALTPSPIRETTYRDTAVRPGERYVYAVVAVDTATPQNVSGQSNRVEESSRAPQ